MSRFGVEHKALYLPVAAAVILANLAWVESACAASERRALLIGINDYMASGVPDLRGAVNDVTMLNRILTTRFGFREDNVVLLTDRAATRSAILSAIDQLVETTDDDDIVYIHLSGHGSRAKDHNGDEEDGFDETFLPADARQRGIRDIVDDELNRRLEKLPIGRTVIVFDSCHSGTVTRAVSDWQSRYVPADDRVELYQSTGRAIVPVENLPHILLTGAPADKEALDGPVDEGFFGLFSYALGRALDKLGPDATPRDIHSSVQGELQRIQEQLYMRPPDPQLEGPSDLLDRPIIATIAGAPQSNGAPPPRRTWLDVRPLSGSTVRLVDGLDLNARAGSQWGIYPPDEVDFKYGDAIAIGTVTETQQNDAILTLLVGEQRIVGGSRAIALLPPDVSRAIQVRLDAAAASRRKTLIELVRGRVPAVEFVGESESARFVVVYGPAGWRVMDARGLQEILAFKDSDDAAVADTLANVFLRAARTNALLALDNPAADLKVTARVITAGEDAQANQNPSYRIKASGERRSAATSLTLEVTTDRDAYLTIVDVDSEGKVNLLFPNSYQNPDFLKGGLVRANNTVRIPDSLVEPNRAGFHWDYGLPSGKDTIRVFASEDQQHAELIRGFISEAARDPAILSGEARSVVTRGVTIARSEATPADSPQQPTVGIGEWAAASLVIEVRE